MHIQNEQVEQAIILLLLLRVGLNHFKLWDEIVNIRSIKLISMLPKHTLRTIKFFVVL